MKLSRRSSGVDGLDELLDGLIPGDNVVWICPPDDPQYLAVERAFVAATAELPWAVVAAGSGAERVPPGATHFDVSPGSALAGPVALADAIERYLADHRGAAMMVDGLERLARRWGSDEAVAFFTRVCPTMLHYEAITYWRLSPDFGRAALERLRQVTQCLFELRSGHLRVLKAESRRASLIGSAHGLSIDTDGAATVVVNSASGRLARGLTAARRDLGLTQAQLAATVGITASAVSQAESGTRGLSLETVLELSERLGVGIERLLATEDDPGYRLARHDRSRTLTDRGVVALADDASIGLRAFLVGLEPGATGEPPVEHHGTQLLAVTAGLVQVDVGADTPVLRAGDSIVARHAPIRRWRNLRPSPAAFHWILRDGQ